MSGTIQVRLPDGRTVVVRADNPQAAAAAARKYWSNQPRKQPTTFLGKVDRAFDVASDLNDSFVDSLLPNWGDEIRGAGRAVRALWNGKDASAAFREGQRAFRADQDRLGRSHPVLKTGAQTAGVLGGMALPAGGALKGASMGQRVRQGARVGAAYGALSGAGEGDGLDLSRRATNAAAAAAPSAVTGALLPVAAAGARRGSQWARTNLPGVDRAVNGLRRVPRAVLNGIRPGAARPTPRGSTAAEQQAYRLAAARMNEGTIANGLPTAGPAATPQVIGGEVARRNDVGVPAMIGDVTQPMRDLTQWTARGVGPGQEMVRAALERRQALQGQRVRQHVQDLLPTTADPIEFVEASKRQAREAAAPLYEQAYAQPMQVTQEIAGITQTPAFRDALPQAHRNIQNQIDPATGLPKDPTAMGLRWFDGDPGSLGPNVPYAPAPGGGYVALDRTLSTEGFDQVARAMADSGRAASHVNPVTGKLESTTNSVHINNRARDLRRLMGEQNDPYRQAVDGFGDEMTQVGAFEQGRDIAKLTGHEINAQRQSLPDVAHETWATGAGTELADMASQFGAKHPTGNAARHTQQALGDDIKQQALSEMTGNSGSVRGLQDRLEYEHQGHLTFKGAYGNSSTAANQQLDADMGAMARAPFTFSGAKNLLLDYVASHAAPQFQQDVKERIGQIVTASDANSVHGVMQAIEAQARRDRGFSDMLHKSGIAATAAYGSNVKPVDAVGAGGYRGY